MLLKADDEPPEVRYDSKQGCVYVTWERGVAGPRVTISGAPADVAAMLDAVQGAIYAAVGENADV